MEIISETLHKTLVCILQLDSIVNIGKLGPTPHSSFYRRTCPFMKGLFCWQKYWVQINQLFASFIFSFVLIATSSDVWH